MKHVGPISGIATHGDRYVATAGYDNQVLLWDGPTKVPVHRVFHDHLANQCTFSPDGRLLATASSDYTARLWTIPDLRLVTVFSGHVDDIEMVAFAPDGQRVATASRDHTIRLFDLAGRELVHLVGHEADVISVSWMPGGTELVSSSDDGTVRRWDTLSGAEIGRTSLEGVETDTIAVTEDGVIFAGDDEGRISLIAGERATQVPAHEAGIKRLVYSPDKQVLVSLSYDRTLAMWERDGDGIARVHTASIPDIIWPRSCAFLGDDRLAFGTFGSSYGVYDYTTGEWDLDGIEQGVGFNAVLAAPDRVYAVGDAGLVCADGEPVQELGTLCNFLVGLGEHILTGGQAGRVFEARTGRELYQHHSPLNCGTPFERDGAEHVAIGTYTGEALIFRLDPIGEIAFVTSVEMHDNAIKGVAATADTLFSVCATGAAAFHSIDDFSCLSRHEDGHDRIANGCVAIQPDRFASVSRDLKLRVWSGDEVTVIDTPHRNSIKCVTASVDGRHIATGSYVGMVAIYDLEQEEWSSVTRPTAAGISCLTPGREPGTFIASSYDGQLYPIAVPVTASLAA